METRNQRLIRKILDEEGDSADNSLHAQALRRATQEDVPRTLTPFEWEQWQAEHGVPPALRKSASSRPAKGWLARLFRR